ncbi:trypsin-2-like [Alligator sinensis]|uniref:Trypsin-2-like n=1 Tax=Alligator sinensis TaxID=38654 RepID=A0A3Q0G8J3_ALLSI|nr:trypsin-2-like [Alligator sinensis]
MAMMGTAPCLLVFLLLPAFLGGLQREDRVLGGSECQKGAHPWLVLLYYFDKHYCSGALLNQNWVLTAAHCSMRHIQVRLGEHNISTSTGYEQFSTVQEAIIHPGFVDGTSGLRSYENDIMLLRLKPPAVYTSYVQPIDLPTLCPLPMGTTCTVMGWGTTSSPEETYPNVPQCLDITTVPLAQCQATYPEKVTENMLCAGGAQEGKDSCQGDSGGPLLCNRKLYGLVSWGDFPCGKLGQPGIYTNVCCYLDWIRTTMEGV